MWYKTLTIPALRRLGQEDWSEFKASVSYFVLKNEVDSDWELQTTVPLSAHQGGFFLQETATQRPIITGQRRKNMGL